MDNTKTKSTKSTSAKSTSVDNEAKEQIVAKEVDLNQYITVRNGFQGRLVYKSKRTGEKFEWDGFGAEQEMELMELKNAKNTSKRFFTDNWFMFNAEDAWVIDFLGVRQYYKNALSIDRFDDIFSKSVTELKKTIAALSPGQKKSVAYRARVLIKNGEIDSLKTIGALEDALKVELIEK